MKSSSDVPDYAVAAAGRAKPTAVAIVVAGLVAAAALFALLGGASSDAPPNVSPSAPGVQYEPNLCEPDGTFCEPTYLSPPPGHPAPPGGNTRISERQTPSG